MPSCVVKSCKNYMKKHKKSQGVSYHAFPRNEHRKDDWVLIIRNCRGENNWNPSSASTICSAHFEESDFITTAKGLRCLVPNAIPKKLLSNPPQTQIEKTTRTTVQVPPCVKQVAKNQQLSSISILPSLLQIPLLTSESAGYCRLCAALTCNGKLFNVQSDNDLREKVVNMLNRLNTNIDFNQEHHPTTICSACIKSLYTAYDFVVGIDQLQMTLNKTSTQMQQYNDQTPKNFNPDNNMASSSTSLQQVSSNIGAARTNFQQLLPSTSKMTTEVQPLSLNVGTVTSDLEQPPSPEICSKMSFLLDSPRKYQFKDNISKKRQIIELQKKNLKRLNQKVRRLEHRNESLKNIMKNLKERNYIDTDLYNSLEENIVAADLFDILNRKKLKKNIKYSQAIKTFCLSLNYYSPSAYDYIRKTFNTCLPHQKTLAKWYSHIKIEPGLSEDSFQVLKAEAEVTQYQLL